MDWRFATTVLVLRERESERERERERERETEDRLGPLCTLKTSEQLGVPSVWGQIRDASVVLHSTAETAGVHM